MKTPIVIYAGPSMLDGSPIVCLASTGSSNVKTGSMVQTWIMRADLHPSEASARKADSSVCGQCPRRHSLGGDCYVQIVHAPRSVWEAWDRSGRPGENWADHSEILRLQNDALAHGLRLGSYGDPMAVPWQVWQDLIDALQPRKIVGYTHQWQTTHATQAIQGPLFWVPSSEGYAWFRAHVMASCDTLQEASYARDLGWRYFLAIPANVDLSGLERTIECPATISDRTCDSCGACDGAGRGVGKASIFLREHGMRSLAKGKRVASLVVL